MARLSDQTQVYANYDKAFVDWVHQLKYNGKSVMCVFATPERAFAQVERQIRVRANARPKVFPLPFVSIQRISTTFEQSRYNNGKYRSLYYMPSKGKWVGTKKPQPISLAYEVNFWARLLEDLDSFGMQILQRMRPAEFWIQVDHPNPVFQRNVLVTMEDMRDFSQIEPEEKQRVLRRIYPFKVHGWLCFPSEEYGRVEKVVTEVYDNTASTPGVLLDEVAVSGEA